VGAALAPEKRAEVVRFLWQLKRRLEIEVPALRDPEDQREARRELQTLNAIIKELE
jgi:hypothetical protein